MLLKSIQLTSNLGEETVDLAQVNIIIGPNNCGKSTLLREVELLLKREDRPRVIVEDIGPMAASFNQLAHQLIDDGELTFEHQSNGGWDFYKSNGTRQQPINIHFGDHFDAKNPNFSALSTQPIDKAYTHRLIYGLTTNHFNDTRLQTLTNQYLQPLHHQQTSLLGRLYVDEEMRERWRQEIGRALGSVAVLNPLHVGLLNVGINQAPPCDPSEELAYHLEECRSYHMDSIPLERMSDGTKAYVGLATSALASGAKLFLIDEPESFLAPKLEERLGGWFSKMAMEQGAQILCATHSASFLKGCILSGASVRVLRLSRSDSGGHIHTLEPDEVIKLSQDPMMRSSGALSALFHSGAIVCEGDTDEAYYSEINARLRSEDRGARDCAFLNAHTKSAISKLLGPLRKMGVPAAAIVDFDFIKQASDQNKVMDAIGLKPIKDTLAGLRATLHKTLKDRGADPKSTSFDELTASERHLADLLATSLEEYGIFLVPVGELERWDTSLDVKKSRWLEKKFEAMGRDPEAPDYVTPTNEGEWAFMDKIAAWIANPERKGMP